MKICVLDFETSDMPPAGGIVQIGWTEVRTYDDAPPEIGDAQTLFVNCGKPIAVTAMAVHHIRPRDIEGAPPVEIALQELTKGSPDLYVAHNCAFERKMFAGGDTPWACTLKVGRRLWPDAPGHSNQVLRYFLGVDDMPGFEPWQALPVHRAAPDSYVTSWLFCEALKHTTVDQMIAWTNQPSLLPGAIHFGKHKGTPWPQVDPTYLAWMLKQDTMDEDARFTAQHWLNRRRSDDR